MQTAPIHSNRDLDLAVSQAEDRFVAANPRSAEANERARRSLPGGNTRSILHYDPFPVTLAKGEGAQLWDLDGHRYIDFLNEYSAGLYGHSEDQILAAIRAALDEGIALGGPNRFEVELAELIRARFPSCELLRFCNSGTEANIMAISLARASTGREAIMVFQHGYHGGVLTFGAAGSPLNVPFPVIVAPYNDPKQSAALIDRHAGELAAVIVEPMMGGGGCIPGTSEFLQALRSRTEQHGIVLIFDEVMTSRLSPTGLQGHLGIVPDMTTFGKYVGGGLTFGAFGGREAVMGLLNPSRPDALAHSGTYNNNVLTMAAGVAGLKSVLSENAVLELNARGETLQQRLRDVAERAGVPLRVTGVGSLFCLHFQSAPIISPSDCTTSPAVRKLVHLAFLERGVYTARRGFVSMSLENREAELDAFAGAFEDLLADYRGVLISA